MKRSKSSFVLLLAAALLVPGGARADWLIVDRNPQGEEMRAVVMNTLSSDGIRYQVATPAQIDDDMLAGIDVVWVVPETIWVDDLATSMNDGDLDAWIQQGGIFAAMGAHNSAAEPLGPAGSRFRSYSVSVLMDERPTVVDADHEIFTGELSGMELLEARFANWGPSCYGTVDPPPGLADAVGRNLGTSPVADSYNTLMWSPENDLPAMIEFTHGLGYVLMNMMPVGWVSPNVVVEAFVRYVHGVEPNFPRVGELPTASAGGPYHVVEGLAIPLDGSGADLAGDPVTFDWDLDGDGAYETLVEDPVFDAAAFDGPTTTTVSLRVSTILGRQRVVEAEVTIDNAAPLAPVPVSPAEGEVLPGPTVTLLTLPAGDVAAEDLMYRFELHRSQAMDDLVQSLPLARQAFQFGEDAHVDMTPPEPGTYYWRAQASDDDLGVGTWSDPRSFTVGDVGGGDGDADTDGDGDADAIDSDDDGACSCSTPGTPVGRRITFAWALVGLGLAALSIRRRFSR